MKTNVLYFICIWSVLCFHIIILPPVNRQSFVCVCICECISTRYKIKNRRKFLILWYPYGRRAHNSNENNKIEWMKTTFVTFSCILRLRSASHQNQKWTNKDIRNIFIWVSVSYLYHCGSESIINTFYLPALFVTFYLFRFIVIIIYTRSTTLLCRRIAFHLFGFVYVFFHHSFRFYFLVRFFLSVWFQSTNENDWKENLELFFLSYASFERLFNFRWLYLQRRS